MVEVELPECNGEWSECNSDCIKTCSTSDEIAPCDPGQGQCTEDSLPDETEESNADIEKRLSALNSAIDDLARMGDDVERFDNGPVQNYNSLFKQLQNDFKNFNSRIEDRLDLSRGCLMVLIILILIVVFREDILKSNFVKSLKSMIK